MRQPIPAPPPPPKPPARRVVIEDDSKAKEIRKDEKRNRNDRAK